MAVSLILAACMAVSALVFFLGYAIGKLHRKAYNHRYFMECKAPPLDPAKIDWTGSVGRDRESCIARGERQYRY